jgi:hypothetical protein
VVVMCVELSTCLVSLENFGGERRFPERVPQFGKKIILIILYAFIFYKDPGDSGGI